MAGSNTLESKLPDVGTTIFTVMSQMALEYGAINLSQGFPAFEPPQYLRERVDFHISSGKNQYAPMTGVQALREALAEKSERLYGVAYHPETDITITSGATEALFSAISAVIRPGDEVLVIEPAYDSYVPAIRLNGGTPVFLTLRGPDYDIDWAEARRLISDKTRLILVNTPNNPTGKVFTRGDLDSLAGLVRGTDIMIVSDEVYEYIVFDGRRHISLMEHKELAERTFVIGSFGKTYHITGWKVGFCLAPAYLTRELRKVHQFLTFSVPAPFQFALADMMGRDEFCRGLPAFYQEKRDLFNGLLSETAFRFKPSEGTFFQTVSFGGLTGESDTVLANRLTREAGVATIPVSAFYKNDTGDSMLRFCFAKDDETLEKAGERLRAIRW